MNNREELIDLIDAVLIHLALTHFEMKNYIVCG